MNDTRIAKKQIANAVQSANVNGEQQTAAEEHKEGDAQSDQQSQ
jgi:hypothetical protein